MIHLRVRTEYSFKRAYGRVEQVLALARGAASMAITDTGTWGHVHFAKAAKKAGIKPIFGVELLVSGSSVTERKVKPTGTMMAFLARTDAGLQELYRLVSTANDQSYYVPRISYEQVNAVSEDIIILSGMSPLLDRLKLRPNVYLELGPAGVRSGWNRRAVATGHQRVVCADNAYPTPADRKAYEILAWQTKETRATLMHLPDPWELLDAVPEATQADLDATDAVAALCVAKLPRAEMVRPEKPASLREMCLMGAAERKLPLEGVGDPENVQLEDAVYRARLDRELNMIEEKKFEDYFYVIADLVNEAKRRMFVGPARGSSAGSLVCYLLGITDVDPIIHGLLFERFIDITREDLPDIDIDFQDELRDTMFTYLEEKYGAERVGRIGTVLRYKAKSAMGDAAKELGIPEWEVKNVKDAIIERSSGDARAQFAIKDTLEGLDVGKALVAKYPAILIAGELEGHATATGKHAAGVVVASTPVRNFCAESEHGVLCIDKKDAETLNMLKIDALGLRTLSILEDCLQQIQKPREWLLTYPLTDTAAFEVLNAENFGGVFQFEGYALQILTRQMKVREFNDIVAITSLARPGPLHSGAATEFVKRRTGREPVTHMHALAEPITGETFGIVVYQEQVMQIGRVIGMLSWEDVSELRKAMSKSLGEEFFNQYWVRFEAGAKTHGITSAEARRIWERMCTFGSWAFNKSHAVSYGLISYWCAMLKAHYPLEFAAASLRRARDDEQSIGILRELVRAGHTFVPVDPARSDLNWSVRDGALLGGLINIKGLGKSKALDILDRRNSGRGYQPGQAKLLSVPRTPFDDIFEAERRYGDIYRNPKAHNIHSGAVSYIRDVNETGEYVFIGQIKEKNLRDANEYGSVVKRGGRELKGQTQFLNLLIEDDTGSIICKIERRDFEELGKPLVESGKIGEWYLWKGVIRDSNWRMVKVRRYRALPMEDGLPPAVQPFNALVETKKAKPKPKKTKAPELDIT
jgi:DNA polymerase III alpha subunit